MLLRRQPQTTLTALRPLDSDVHRPSRSCWRWLRRRGATMMEYLVCLSFIIAVLILAVQHIGGTTGTMFKNNANAVPAGTTGS
jgi:Flp pilus assembly pilin Flp